MIPNIANYISGTVSIRIKGDMPEKFINLCLTQNIFLWNIAKVGNDFYACMRLPDFFCIRPIARKSHTKVKVLSHRGLPFVIKRIKHRKMMVVGALLCLLALNIAASYIWFVDVTGLKNIPAERIKQIAWQNGLKPGIIKDSVNAKTVENEILLTVPEIAWVGVNFTGTRAVIEVVEKTMPKQEDKAPAHIVAEKDGIITDFIVLNGQPAVKKGDTVKKGDILIRGIISEPLPTNETVQSPHAGTVVPQQRIVKAKGIIKARVWYESYGEAELSKLVYNRTGRKEVGVSVRIGSNELILKKAKNIPFDQYETEVIDKKLPFWRNSGFTVESSINIYHELESSLAEKTLDEASDEARAKALASVQSLIPETAHVLSRNIEVLQTAEPNLVRVKISVETIEDIGHSISITDSNP